MIIFILRYLFLFLSGALMGWVLEFFYRRYLGKAKRWMNPGFLSGPYLPLYGTGVCLLYIISELQMAFGVKLLLFAIVTTTVEYVTGIFFLKFYNTRLWDYNKLKFNVQGIIAPLYTFYWTVLSLFFYFVLYPYFFKQVSFIYQNLEFSLFIGIFYGVAIVDTVQSFNVINRLKVLAANLENSHIAIQYEQLKWDIAERFDDLSERVDDITGKLEGISGKVNHLRPRLRRPTFLRPFSGDYNLRRHLQVHYNSLKNKNNGDKMKRIMKSKS